MNFEYCYHGQIEINPFFRMPKQLFTEPEFRRLSGEAKLLYGMMLDRVNLSAANGWFDKLGRVYIYFSMKEVQQIFNCGHDKALKLLAELDSGKGIGLIHRKKRGCGKASIIYVKHFSPRPKIGPQDI